MEQQAGSTAAKPRRGGWKLLIAGAAICSFFPPAFASVDLPRSEYGNHPPHIGTASGQKDEPTKPESGPTLPGLKFRAGNAEQGLKLAAAEAKDTTQEGVAAWRQSELYGSWRIKSSHGYMMDSDGHKIERDTTLDGVLIFTPDHRMIAFVITSPDREVGTTDQAKLKLFDSMVTYSGRFTLDPEKYVVLIDWSSTAGNQGVPQTRYYKVEGDTLTITVHEHQNISDPTKRNANTLTAVRER